MQTIERIVYLLWRAKQTHVYADHMNLLYVFAPLALHPSSPGHVISKFCRRAVQVRVFHKPHRRNEECFREHTHSLVKRISFPCRKLWASCYPIRRHNSSVGERHSRTNRGYKREAWTAKVSNHACKGQRRMDRERKSISCLQQVQHTVMKYALLLVLFFQFLSPFVPFWYLLQSLSLMNKIEMRGSKKRWPPLLQGQAALAKSWHGVHEIARREHRDRDWNRNQVMKLAEFKLILVNKFNDGWQE